MEDQQFAYAAILLSCLNSKYYDIEDEIEEDDDVDLISRNGDNKNKGLIYKGIYL
jgi:hypothetical protein